MLVLTYRLYNQSTYYESFVRLFFLTIQEFTVLIHPWVVDIN